MTAPSRVFAVDWSGDRKADRRKIWLCEAEDGRVLRLENGRSREEVTRYLTNEAKLDPSFVVGLDFAFSFPAQFLRKRAHHEVGSVWEEAGRLGEDWLAHCPFPFWGKPGKKKPLLGEALYRRTELEVAHETGFQPMSVMQIGGAGAVGVGSIRGMPLLAELRAAGLSVWPFDPPRLPLVVEIWPRLFTGNVVKGNDAARKVYLAEHLPALGGAARHAAEEDDNAFDALISGLAMDATRVEFGTLLQAADAHTLLEGKIWQPAGDAPPAWA